MKRPNGGINARDVIETYHQIAIERGGKCLSNFYKNQKTKLTFECKVKHQWTSSADAIKAGGTWCPTCAGVSKPDISEAHRLAEQKHGKCLSTQYTNAKTKLNWLCKANHEWQATLNVIRKGHWCNICGDKDRAGKSNYSKKLIHWKTGEAVNAKASFEIAVVNYLNKNKIDYKWQPRQFVTPFLTKSWKKPSKYTPDLYIPLLDLWIEIKGYFKDQESKDKWEWFHKAYPNSILWDEKELKSLGIYDKKIHKKLYTLSNSHSETLKK